MNFFDSGLTPIILVEVVMLWKVHDGVVDVSRPILMGVLNASPESFSESGLFDQNAFGKRIEDAVAMVDGGAEILDVGGQSARTDQAEIPIQKEIDRVVPYIEEIRSASNVVLSVDTYRPEVAEAALNAGANIINDVSGSGDPSLLDVVVRYNAGLVIMHTRLKPKVRLSKTDSFYAGPEELVSDVVSFLQERIASAVKRGVPLENIIVDPGPDFAKTPAQTIAILQHLKDVVGLGRPVLLALSRKDFVGAATERLPQHRGAGTIAAFTWCIQKCKNSVLRVHDVTATRDMLAVVQALEGETILEWDEPLADSLRYSR